MSTQINQRDKDVYQSSVHYLENAIQCTRNRAAGSSHSKLDCTTAARHMQILFVLIENITRCLIAINRNERSADGQRQRHVHRLKSQTTAPPRGRNGANTDVRPSPVQSQDIKGPILGQDGSKQSPSGLRSRWDQMHDIGLSPSAPHKKRRRDTQTDAVKHSPCFVGSEAHEHRAGSLGQTVGQE